MKYLILVFVMHEDRALFLSINIFFVLITIENELLQRKKIISAPPRPSSGWSPHEDPRPREAGPSITTSRCG